MIINSYMLIRLATANRQQLCKLFSLMFSVASRWLCWLAIVCGLAIVCWANAACGDEQPSAKATSFLATHCLDCHSGQAADGGLNLSELQWQMADTASFARWIKVFDKVEQGEMPPAEAQQPSVAARAGFTAELQQRLLRHNTERQATLGRVALRRLNRAEYAHSLRQLLGISTPLEELLPEDGRAAGFDNVASALDLSVAHMERYLEAADQALREATVTTIDPPTVRLRTNFEETWHDYNHGFQNSQWANAEDGNLAIRWTSSAANGTLRAWHPPIPDARYRFRVRARAMMQREVQDAEGKKSKAYVHDRFIIAKLGVASLLKDGLAYDEAYFELSPHEYREIQYEARIPAGHSLSVMPYRLVPQNDKERVMTGDMLVVVDWVDIEGPLYGDLWPPAGHRMLYGELPIQPDPSAGVSGLGKVVSKVPLADARRLLKDFLPRIFRRPVADHELEAHLDLFREQLSWGRPFDEALRAAYKMALASPQFLFLQEAPGPLDDYALAARLSLGLWGCLPDTELMQLAEQGTLRDPAILRAQTERLLCAPQSHWFTQQFLGGWLNLRDINFTQPDSRLYPEFDSYLQSSMVTETEQFFEELVRHNLGVGHIVDSDFALLNERLAEHYDLTAALGRSNDLMPTNEVFPPEQARLVKVALPADSKRGGLLTQGAVLKVSANGTTTSPVVRGAYVLDRILGIAPELPPSNVPAVEPDIRGATTIRQQLDLHRNQPACAGCHAKLDPPGFALENYDVTGRWRTHYRAIPESSGDKLVKVPGSDERLYVQGLPVEAHYALANGRQFADIDEFKKLVLEDEAQLAGCLVSKLMTYLTGAAPELADRKVIDDIVSQAADSRYGLRDLIHGVIQSRVFTHK